MSKNVVLPTLPALRRLVLVVNSYLDILQVWQGSLSVGCKATKRAGGQMW